MTIDDIICMLESAESNERGFAILNNCRVTRDELKEIARKQSVHIPRWCGKYDAKVKIISSIVGRN
ncbi:hypothetical protein UFOVP1244_109 [uncultured Caudovirales phage]|uniref:Uncharacterized protein n=1 Tax=uncultured Caudovirales phage TaxID=2100421 RepID=A0A6J5RAR3_9CAUD|nr:hypothetical protein UFOVP1244_109 [uncultured Caudovirales phage]